MSLEDVVAAIPSLRQSLLAGFDDCPLSAFMELKFANGWSTYPQARGTIFHLFAALFLNELRTVQSRTLPVQLAEQILIQACRQEFDANGERIPPEDIVRVPLREMKDLRMAARKFAADNAFSFDRIIDIERRLSATLTYPHPDGGLVERRLTGKLDALLSDPADPDGAVVLDWKDTWGLPPEPKDLGREETIEDELRGLSYEGYFQQRFYAWLVMKCYPNVQRVTLREFYVRKTVARKATVTRASMPEIEEELSVLAQAFDMALAQGVPSFPYGWFPVVDPETGEVSGRELDIERLGRWKPQPGRHCGFCARSRACPIEEDTRIEAGAPPATPERAAAIAGEIQVVEQVRTVLYRAAKAYVETSGRPIPVKDAKGRRALGWVQEKSGRRFKLFVPSESDRGGRTDDIDGELRDAMQSATSRARRERRPRGAGV